MTMCSWHGNSKETMEIKLATSVCGPIILYKPMKYVEIYLGSDSIENNIYHKNIENSCYELKLRNFLEKGCILFYFFLVVQNLLWQLVQFNIQMILTYIKRKKKRDETLKIIKYDNFLLNIY